MLSTVPVLGMAIVTLAAIAAMWCYRWVPARHPVGAGAAVAASSAYWYCRNRSSVLDATAPVALAYRSPAPPDENRSCAGIFRCC